MMKATSSFLVIALLLGGFAPALRAQGQSSGGSSGGGSGGAGVFVGSDGFDANGIKRYQLGPGDIIDLRVYGQPEFNSALSVDDDGKIELPFVDQPIIAKCKTDRQIRKEVTDQLKKYIKRPQVSIRIAERRSRPPAIVYGAVRSPQRVLMNREIKLLELLAVAGGVTEGAGSEIQIFHTASVMCPESDEATETVAENDETVKVEPASAIKRSSESEKNGETVKPESATTAVHGVAAPTTKTQQQQQEADALAANDEDKQVGKPADEAAQNEAPPEDPLRGKFDLYSIAKLRAGDAEANPKILPGDIVIVTEASPVFITGAVLAPSGPIPLRDQLSLRYAIAMVGGLRKDAKPGNIRIFRRVVGSLKPEIIKVDYNAIKNQKQPDIALQAYDVIDVPSSTFTPQSVLQMMLGTGMGAVTNVGATLPLRVLY